MAVTASGQREPLNAQAEASIIVDMANTVQVRAHIPMLLQQSNALAAQSTANADEGVVQQAVGDQ